MHRTDQAAAILTRVRFGFGPDHLHIRLDGRRPLRETLGDGCEVVLTFIAPEGVRYTVGHRNGQEAGRFWTRVNQAAPWEPASTPAGSAAAGTLLEIALPLSALTSGGTPSSLAFFVAVVDAAGTEIERHPAQGPVRAAVPDERFASRHWTA